MLTLLFFALLLCFFLCSPRLKAEMLPDGAYITRERTCMINGFFIWFVFIRHMGDYFPSGVPSYDYVVYKLLMFLFQCVVATFLFYSGFGLMSSIRGRNGYGKELMIKRFPTLWLYLAFAITVFLGVQAYYGVTYSVEHILQSYIAWKGVGNSVWYIGITLISYLIIALSCGLFFRKGEKAVAAIATLFFMLLVYVMYCIKGPLSHWYNTFLCIPAGMWFCLYRKEVERCIKFLRVPAWVCGAVLIPFSLIIYYYLFHPWPCLHNIAAVLFALGVTLVFSCIALKKIPSFLCWSGGPAIFFIYIFQRVPMIIGFKEGWAIEYPFAYQLFCVFITLLIAWGCSKSLPKLAQWLFVTSHHK